jgi:hypothetical protein
LHSQRLQDLQLRRCEHAQLQAKTENRERTTGSLNPTSRKNKGPRARTSATTTAESINPVPQFTTWILAHKNHNGRKPSPPVIEFPKLRTEN